MGRLSYNIVGLQEFSVSFQDFCMTCEWQKNCQYGKSKPFQLMLDCKEITLASDKKKAEEMEKLEKKHPDWSWDKREKKVKVRKTQIFSILWADKVKSQKDEILCLDSRKLDSMLTSQQGEEWWSEFRETMDEIYEECSRIY